MTQEGSAAAAGRAPLPRGRLRKAATRTATRRRPARAGLLGNLAGAAMAALTLVGFGVISVVATSGTAGANAPTPSSLHLVATPHSTGKLTVTVSGDWTWPTQTCKGRYGEGVSVTWWGISATKTPANNFVLSTATEVTTTGTHTLSKGDMSPTGSVGATIALPLKNVPATKLPSTLPTGAQLYFHEGSEFDGIVVNTPTTCKTTTASGKKGSQGAYAASATYPSAADVPPAICVNLYDLHGTEGRPAGTSTFNPATDNDSSITTNAFDPLSQSYCLLTAPAIGSPEFKVLKTDVPGSGAAVLPGSVIKYTITVTNVGTAKGSAVLTDALPSTLASATTLACKSTPGCTATLTGRTVEIHVSTLATSGVAVVTFSAKVATSATSAVVNTAAFSSTTPCVATGCSSSVSNPLANFSVVKTDVPGNGHAVSPGQKIPYTISVHNAGTGPGSVTVSDPLPANLSYVATTAKCGATEVGCTASIGSTGRVLTITALLAPDGTDTVTFTATVSAQATGHVLNTATITTGACTGAACSSSVTNVVTATPPSSTTPGTTSTPTTPATTPATTPGTTPATTAATVPVTAPATSTVTGATTVHTGEPWAGSTPFELGAAAAGLGLLALGEVLRRRVRRSTAGR